MIDLTKNYYIKKEINDFIENKKLQKGSIIKFIGYNSNNCYFKVKTANNENFLIDENYLNKIYLEEVKDDN